MHRRTFALTFATLALTATGALAQAVCGMPDQPSDWAGGSADASDVSVAEGPLAQSIAINGTVPHVTQFALSEPADVRLEARPEGAGDTIIRLLTDTGEQLAEDDDGGGNLASRIETTLQAGTYCLVTAGFDDSAMTATIQVGRTEHEAMTTATDIETGDEICAPDTAAEPLTVTAEAMASGGLVATGMSDETPFYRFTLDRPTALTIGAENNDHDPAVKLFDGQGRLLGENDDADGLNARLDMTDALPVGDYCIAVRMVGDSAAPITVTVSVFDPEAAKRRLFATGEASPPVDGSYPVTALGPLDSTLQDDFIASDEMGWYSFELAAPGLVVIDGIGAGLVDPTLRLFDAFGRPISSDDDGGDETNARIATPLQPGTYMVGLGRVGDSSFGLLRLVVQRYVPAE